MYAGEVSWEEFREARGKPAVVVFGAIEPHGRHLPLDTDSIIPWELARRLEKKADVVVFPPVNFGYVYTLRKYPGAISLTSRTLHTVAEEIFSELFREGFTRILVIIGHGGNTGPVKSSLKELADDFDFRAAVVEWWKLTEVEAGHADEVESSLVLAAGYSLRKPPAQEPRKDYVGAVVPAPDDLFTPSGYIGNVGDISREKGEKIYSEVVEKLEKMLEHDLLLES
ncbi:MAG: creatininase family protein [Candidatus Micrarchaeia archaeon]